LPPIGPRTTPAAGSITLIWQGFMLNMGRQVASTDVENSVFVGLATGQDPSGGGCNGFWSCVKALDR